MSNLVAIQDKVIVAMNEVDLSEIKGDIFVKHAVREAMKAAVLNSFAAQVKLAVLEGYDLGTQTVDPMIWLKPLKIGSRHAQVHSHF
jgi:hypothetical protein